MIATILFFGSTLGLVLLWNRLFQPVRWRIVFAIWGTIVLYQGETLFTRKVDVPAAVTAETYPWKAAGIEGGIVNTGLAVHEMLPWTETARQIVKAGEAPLWNRRLGAGAPLLSDQQHAVFHPFTLLGFWLSIGKAWTLSFALRLFFALFFFFVLLRNHDFHEAAALFGAVAYGFSTFHTVNLVMPLGLTVMMLPMALAAADEFLRRPRLESFLFLVAALVCTVLGGHPEAQLWVGLTTGAYALYLTVAERLTARRLMAAALAAVTALLLTAFLWYPTTKVVPLGNRYHLMKDVMAAGIEHHIGAQWLMVLVSPNILGTVQGNSYRPPEPRSGDLLDDYGETACGYAGLATLALAFAAIPRVRRRRPGMFALGALVIALLTITETPLWNDLLLRVPLLNLALFQRLRLVWSLGVAILAVISLDGWIRGEMPWRQLAYGAIAAAALFGVVVAAGLPTLLPRASQLELLQIFGPAVVVLLVVVLARLPARVAVAVSFSVLIFLDLVLTTWRYNKPAKPEDVLPETGAIRAMRGGGREPYRVVTVGPAFPADTPGFYGLEDLRSTSPFTTPEYLRLFGGFFAAKGFEQVVEATHYPFADYMNVRYLYVPPGGWPLRDDVIEVYRGPDGAVFRNDRALPRYFFVRRLEIEPSYGDTVAKMRFVPDFRETAFTDHIPPQVQRMAPALPREFQGGSVEVMEYGPNSVLLSVESRGWNLLVSSDTWWPGWRAYWNRRRMPHVRVNGAFVGVFVPPGRGVVRLWYRPKAFDDGIKIAMATLFVLVAAAYAHARFRKRGIAPPAQPAAAA